MHRALVLSVFSSVFLVLTTLSGTTGDSGIQPLNTLHDDASLLQSPVQQQSSPNSREFDDDSQVWKDFKSTMAKKGWKDLHGAGWGKRAWKDIDNLRGIKNSWADTRLGYTKPSFYDFQVSKRTNRDAPWGKRSWGQFNGGWGKRDFYNKDDLAEIYDELYKYDEDERDMNDEMEKKDWNSFQGAWGKRDPAWHNLNGMWGKRGGSSKWDRLNGGWG